MIASSRHMVEELGVTQGLLETEQFAGLVALIEGHATAAEQSLRAAYDGFRTHGLGIDAARAAAMLGIALLAQGRAAEAKRSATRARRSPATTCRRRSPCRRPRAFRCGCPASLSGSS